MENEQPQLFPVEEWYNLRTIEDTVRQYVKHKFPSPVDCQDMDDYLEDIEDEYRLELAYRLGEISKKLEQSVIKKIKQNILIPEEFR